MNSYEYETLKVKATALLKQMDQEIGEMLVSEADDFEAAKDFRTYRLLRKICVDAGKLLEKQDRKIHDLSEKLCVLEEATKRLEEENRGRKRVLDELESIKYDPDKRV